MGRKRGAHEHYYLGASVPLAAMKKIFGFSALAVAVFLAGCIRFHPRPLSPADTAANLENRSLTNPALQTFLETNLHRELTNTQAAAWDFDMLLLAAFYYQPSLEVARAQWRVSQAEIKTAGGRPNPTVSLLPEYDFTPMSGASPWLPAITFDLPLETAGKRRYRVARSQHLSEAARLNIAATAWQVRARLRSSLLDFSAAGYREATLQKQFSAQDQVVNLLQQRLQAGAISSTELAPARLALAKTRLDLIETKRQHAEARAAVAQAIGVPVKALNEIAFAASPLNTLPAGSDLLSADLRPRALRSRTDILASLAEYEASQSALQLEIAKQYPDVHLGTGYQWDQGENKWQLGLTAEIPVLNRNQGPIAEAAARRAEAAARFHALQAKVIADLDRAFESFQAAEKSLAALEQVAAAQQQQLTAVEGQLRAGAADQVDLLNAQIEFGVAALARVDTLIKINQALATLEDAVQRPIDLPAVNLESGTK
jgi:outer membrane protein TolC